MKFWWFFSLFFIAWLGLRLCALCIPQVSWGWHCTHGALCGRVSWGGSGLCTHSHCSTSNCHSAGTAAATYCYLPFCTHCWWAALQWGKLLSVPNAVYFCKNLVLFSRTTGKISMGLEDLSRLWNCYHWEIVLLSKCPISSFFAWLIIDMIKMSQAFCALCFPLSWWFSQTFLHLEKAVFCSSQSYKWLLGHRKPDCAQNEFGIFLNGAQHCLSVCTQSTLKFKDHATSHKFSVITLKYLQMHFSFIKTNNAGQKGICLGKIQLISL